MDEMPNLAHQDQGAANIARLRLDIHVYLHYWHTRLFLGRPFLLKHSTSIPTVHGMASSPSAKNLSAGDLLARDSVDAAVNIIQLCQMIHDKIGLAIASYATEFTSCRAAMLVLVAKGITDKSTALSDLLAQGLAIIQQMSTGQGQASAEARVIEALQRAIMGLHRRKACRPAGSTAHSSDDPPSYDKFREWEELWQRSSMPPSEAPTHSAVSPAALINHINVPQPSLDTGWTLAPSLLNDFGVWGQEPDDVWSTILHLDEFSLISCADTVFEPPEPSTHD